MDDSNPVENTEFEAEDSTEQLPDSPAPIAGEKITLQVGERRFVTTRGTLTQESGFFSSMLSRLWDNAEADGSYFIDSDPVLFEHILRYLRRGVRPVFYDNLRGHDHALYQALLEEARYFQIEELENWLASKSYLQKVKVMHSAEVVEEVASLNQLRDANMDVEYLPSWITRKIYICPRGIPVHKGNPNACGKQCMKAQGDTDIEYEEEQVLKVVVIKKRTIFD